VKRFEYYLKATGINKDTQKKALLLHVSGNEVQDIYETLPEHGTRYDDVSFFWSPANSHDTANFDSLTIKLSVISVSPCFVFLNKYLS
jgi:phage-related protein